MVLFGVAGVCLVLFGCAWFLLVLWGFVWSCLVLFCFLLFCLVVLFCLVCCYPLLSVSACFCNVGYVFVWFSLVLSGCLGLPGFVLFLFGFIGVRFFVDVYGLVGCC